jgi:hypothetical protein
MHGLLLALLVALAVHQQLSIMQLFVLFADASHQSDGAAVRDAEGVRRARGRSAM